MDLDPHNRSPLSVEELAAIFRPIRAPDSITAPAAEEGTKGQHREKALAADSSAAWSVTGLAGASRPCEEVPRCGGADMLKA